MSALELRAVLEGATAAHGRHVQLRSAAQEFEATLLKELLEPLGRDPLSESALGQGEDGQALQSFASECLAKRLAASGGFGLADKMLAQLERLEQDERRSRRQGVGPDDPKR